MQKNIMNRF